MSVFTPDEGSDPTALVELRILEGPNLYFSRAAVKLTLDVADLTAADEARVRAVGSALGLRSLRPGPPGTGFRQRALLRLVTQLVRRTAHAAGTTRLGVRTRLTSDADRLVVVYPWRDRSRARALGEGVVAVLDGLATPEVAASDVEAAVDRLVAEAGERVRAVGRGPGPTTLRPRVPVVAVTGTNGKTTTSRMIAHLARTAGHHVGWSNTDGIYVDGVQVEEGDYSGPSGAGLVLAHKAVDFAVTETARGGILLKGIGVVANDVSVVTNVSADHLGMQGIGTVDQLAEVKGVVPRITKKTGWAVLNADDPRVFAMRLTTKARPWVFSREPDSPALREVLGAGGRATTVIDGWITVLDAHGTDPLVEVVDVPMTLAGLSRFNVENALAAASAALAARIDREYVVAGLRSFRPDAAHNPGRMNCFSLDDATVVVDLAHNEAGLEAMIEVMRGLRRPGARLLLGLGAVGDRQDDLLEMLGEIAGRDADVVAIGHKQKYLRGRTVEEVDALLRTGAERVGATDVASYDTELASLQALVAQAGPGDVVGLMCHAERQPVYDWLDSMGATADGPDDLAAKVRAALDEGEV
ncbi:Mur ligase family protein, partial [Nocardioides aequoreus]|uniref:Mur ligase family protein n=1 Tax=Nocardioides aequoreus TaxID=397278 RepID=UPI0004C369B3